jgi:hypothetical protein
VTLSLAWKNNAVTRTGRFDVCLIVCRLDPGSVMALAERESGCCGGSRVAAHRHAQAFELVLSVGALDFRRGS